MIPYSLTNTASISLDAIGTIQTPLSLLGLESINISGFGSWSTPGYMIYQYAINNVSQCITSIDKYNINNTNANFIDFAQAVENGKFQCDPVLGAYMGNYIPGQYLSFYWADQTIHAPIATLGASWNNLSNTPTTFIGNIYNINNYSLNVIYDNQPGVYYLVNGSYNQPASSAAGANTTWSQLGATQYFTNTELEYNQSYNTNYIPFYPTIYNTATGSMTVNLLSSASIFNSYYPGVLPNGFSINTTPNASNVPFFNPLGYDTSFPSCGSANNVISYILPDGTPLPLDIYLGSSSCKGSEQYNIPAFAQLFYNPANYPTVNCNASTAVCTTPNGNSYQLNFTANSASGIALSATIIN